MAKLLLPLLFLIICLLPVADGLNNWCGTSTKPAPPLGKDHFKQSAAMEKSQQTLGFHPITIPVIFHYIKLKSSTTTEATAPSYDRLLRSIYAVNLGYTGSNTGFEFTLNSTLLFHDESSLATCENMEALAGKYGVRFTTTLNIYICDILLPTDDFIGFANFPYLYDGKSNSTWVFLKTTQIVSLNIAYGGPTDPLYSPSYVPNDDELDNSVGATIIHEIGHWVGMFHPFQNGCTCCDKSDSYCLSGASSSCLTAKDPSSGTCGKVCGDSVADTPAVMNPQQALSSSQFSSCSYDTCPSLPGVDDSHNYMSYDDITCHYFNGALQAHFTFGQVVRARSQMLIYRKEFFPDVFPVGGRKTWTNSYSKQPIAAAQSKSNSLYPSFKKTQNVRKVRKLRKQ